MKPVEHFEGIYLYRDAVDMRKSINGLSAIVQGEMNLDPFSGFLFVFCNQRRRIIKILYWDRSGFALWTKRLEEDKFPWPRKFDKGVLKLRHQHLHWLLDGYEYWKLKPHKNLNYSTVF